MHIHNLETGTYYGTRVSRRACRGTHALSPTPQPITQEEGIQRYNGLMQTANRVNNLSSSSGHDRFSHAHNYIVCTDLSLKSDSDPAQCDKKSRSEHQTLFITHVRVSGCEAKQVR